MKSCAAVAAVSLLEDCGGAVAAIAHEGYITQAKGDAVAGRRQLLRQEHTSDGAHTSTVYTSIRDGAALSLRRLCLNASQRAHPVHRLSSRALLAFLAPQKEDDGSSGVTVGAVGRPASWVQAFLDDVEPATEAKAVDWPEQKADVRIKDQGRSF